MKRYIALLITIFLSLAVQSAAGAGSRVPVWETVELRDGVVSDDNSDPIDVSTREQQIYITTSRPIEVSVYTILGQLITKRKISPGKVRLTLGTRGIYILKTETATFRINL